MSVKKLSHIKGLKNWTHFSLPVEILDKGARWIFKTSKFFCHSSAGKRITQMQFQIDKMKEEIFNLEQGNIFYR